MEHERTTPRKCLECGAAWNTINGRWCGRLARYVEHTKEPACKGLPQPIADRFREMFDLLSFENKSYR